MYPDFIAFLQNLLPGKIYKKFYSVLHSRPIFYTVCHDQNEWQMPERVITGTICHDEPKFYLN